MSILSSHPDLRSGPSFRHRDLGCPRRLVRVSSSSRQKTRRSPPTAQVQTTSCPGTRARSLAATTTPGLLPRPQELRSPELVAEGVLKWVRKKARTPCTRESTGRGVSTRRKEPTVWTKPTWLVQTLLKVTNANVCASIVLAKSCLASNKGIAMRESEICGKNASDSTWKPVSEGCWELRCSRVLYTEKLWRWSRRLK